MKHIFLFVIRFYLKCISTHTHAHCRFYPTCSQYAYEAVSKYGAIKGGYLSLRRILRCHPFYKGNWYDPVP